MSNIIYPSFGLQKYRARIAAMDKLELLEEMVTFQQERSKAGDLTRDMMERVIILFKALEATASTPELRLLTRSYHRHLTFELDKLRNK